MQQEQMARPLNVRAQKSGGPSVSSGRGPPRFLL